MMQYLKKQGMMTLLLVGGLFLGLLLVFSDGKEEAVQVGSMLVEEQYAEEEARVRRLLEGMEGVNGVRVMLMRTEQGEVVGAAVTCEQGDSAVIQQKIISTLRALYGIGAHRISVTG